MFSEFGLFWSQELDPAPGSSAGFHKLNCSREVTLKQVYQKKKLVSKFFIETKLATCYTILETYLHFLLIVSAVQNLRYLSRIDSCKFVVSYTVEICGVAEIKLGTIRAINSCKSILTIGCIALRCTQSKEF